MAIELNPNNAGYYNSRGNAYYNLERYEEALLGYTEAIALEPANPAFAVVYCNRGDTYMKLNNKESALKDYEKALGMEPENETFRERVEAIKKTQ